MKFVVILAVLGAIAWFALQRTQTGTQAQQQIVDQFEGITDCQDMAIAASGEATTAEDEMRVRRARMDECMKAIPAR